MRLEGFLRYVVGKALSGDVHVLRAMLMFFGEDLSVSEIGKRLGVSKNQVRGWVQRVYEFLGCKGFAKIAVTRLVPIVLEVVEPVIERRNGLARCVLCGEDMFPEVAYDHVKRMHWRLIEKYVDAVLDRAAKNRALRS